MVAPAWRFWRRRPGQLLWLSATLGLGVAGFVAALAIADALWLRPLPIDDPGRVVSVAPYIGQSALPIEDATFDVWQARAHPFDAIAVYGFELPTEIRTAQTTERARVAAVGPNLFDMLRAQPHLGRLLQVHDETTDAAVPTVMSLAPAFLVARLCVLAFVSAAPIGSGLVPTELLRLRTASLGSFELSAGIALAVVLGGVIAIAMAGVITTWTGGQTWNRTSTMTRRDVRIRQGVIAGQVAVLLALIVAAGLTTAGLTRLINQPLGFEPQGVFHFEVTRARGATAEEKAAQLNRLYAAAMSVPGVRHVAASWAAPLSPVEHRVIRIDADSGMREFLHRVPVSAGYFRALGGSIVAGRDFVSADRGQSAAIVNRRLAMERFGAAGSAVGGAIDYGRGLSLRIVGVVEDMRQFRLAEPMGPTIYPLYEPDTDTALFVNIVVKADPRAQAAVLEQLRSVDHTRSIVAGSLDERFAEQTAMARLLSRFFGALGAFAMLVAAVGVFGAIRQQSLARRRELGIRLAIGASTRAMLATVTRSLALPLVVGLAGGMALTWWGAPLLERYLFATSAFEPAVWLASLVALCGAVAAAGLLPALTVLRWNVAEIVRQD